MMCEMCGNRPATEKHHKLSQTKLNKKLYREWIHHPDNIMNLCYDCHHNKSIIKWTELEFCKHFKIYPKSKYLKQKTLHKRA